MIATLSVISIALVTITNSACIPLQGTTACPRFSTLAFNQDLAEFPFLQTCASAAAFDEALHAFIEHDFPHKKYREQFSCPIFNSTSNSYYARYARSLRLMHAVADNSGSQEQCCAHQLYNFRIKHAAQMQN